ncbi:hypothetical protein [Conexibacter arvalis]|nr:hypothetical protein [Conexibacter arvalis]
MVQELRVTITPGKAGTPKKPKGAAIGVTIQSPSPQPATTQNVKVLFGKGIRFNNRLFPRCSLKSIQATKSLSRCPKGSIVGRGTARAIGFIGSAQVPEDLTVTAINSTNNSLILWLNGAHPLPLSDGLVGKLGKASGKYAHRLDVTIPKGLREVMPGVYAPLVFFDVDVKATTTVKKGKGRRARRVKVHYVETTNCPSGGWPFAADFSFDPAAPFTDDPLTAVSPAARCS